MPATRPPSPPPTRILLIRPSALGDVCRTVPVAAALKRAFPDAAIDWIVQDSFVDAVSAHPAVRCVIPFPRKRFSTWWKPSIAKELIAWLSALRREKYDLVLDCQGLARSGFFAWCTRARVRIGYKQAAEGAWLALTHRVDAPMSMHAVDRMMSLADEAIALHGKGGAGATAGQVPCATAGADPCATAELLLSSAVSSPREMKLFAPPGALETLRTALADRATALDAPYAVIAPTSRWPGKLWPADRYATIVRSLISHRGNGTRGMTCIIVGSEHERSQCGPLLELCRTDTRVIDAIGKTSIATLMALVERASLVIGSDSACVHMAAGFDVPLVALFGPTDVSKVGPYAREASVIQKLLPGDHYDHKNEAHGRAMMERITTDDVERMVAKELDERRQ